MTTSTSSTNKWEPKYLERLAKVYLEKYETVGYIEAKEWYRSFLTRELRDEVRPIIQRIVERRGVKKKP